MELRQRLSRLMTSSLGRWWDIPAALMLLAAHLIVAKRLVITEWTDHLSVVQTLTFLAVLAGLALGQSAFSSRRVAAFALAYGLFAIPWQLGVTLSRISEDALWTERLVRMVRRLILAVGQMARQEPVEDPLFFLLLVASLAWVLGVHAGYALTHHARPWRAILPSGIALLVIQTYDPFVTARVWFLAFYLLFALLLVARVTYLRHRARWQRDRFYLPSYVGSDITRITLQITVLLVLVAWTVPVLATALSPAQDAWRRVTRPWITVRNRLENAVASLRDQVGGVYNIYSDNLALGQGGELSEDIVLVVEPEDDPPVDIRYYWRARVYDYYADGQWSTTVVSTTPQIVPGYLGLPFPDGEGRWTGAFTVTTALPISTLYIPGQPLWLSRAVRADLAENPDGTADIIALHANPPLRGGATYEVRSSLNTVTIAQLRSAGTDYPSWVTSRYLQLPPNITPRVRELARQVSYGLDVPYDIAAAITEYLRRYIRYSETIPSPSPSDREPLDWFLFDLREGFCNYYASAEVVMLRSLGIPARLAVGFGEGQLQPGRDIFMASRADSPAWSEDSDIYVVRQRNSHSWPEVYFPGLGWIEFEPTASEPPLDRPLGDDQLSTIPGFPTFMDDEGDPREPWEMRREEIPVPVDPLPGSSSGAGLGSRLSVIIGILSLGLVLIIVAVVWYRRRSNDQPLLPVLLRRGLRRFDLRLPLVLDRWIIHITLPLLVRAYMEINYALIRLGVPPSPADTPAERAAALSHLLPGVANPTQHLLAEYHAMAYSRRPGDLYTAERASRTIRSLSWRAAIRRLIDRLASRLR